jgi:Uma2 family endonuclease
MAEPTLEAARLMTLDELMQTDARIEIMDGEIIEMPGGGGLHHVVVSNTLRILDRFVVLEDIGSVFPDGLHYLMYSPTSGLKDSFVPDVSFVRNENIPADWDIEKPHPGVPDLAVEVISPGDDAEQVQRKVRTYLDKGTQQVWLMYPKTREVHQFIAGEPETVRIYKGDQTIDAEALFPGIQGLTIEAIFKLPKWAIKENKSDG